VTPGERAGARLVADKEEIARALTDALYRERPEMLERWGEAGRAKCLQDMRYNLEHLAPAVALDAPDMFAGYARWLLGLLTSRGIPAADVARSLALTRALVEERFPADEASAATPSIDAALAVLGAPGP
jgi:phycobilisome protein